MFDQHHSGSELVIHVEYKAAHVLLFFNVHASHRFIKQQYLGRHRQCAAKVHAFLKAVGQLANRRFSKGLDFQKVDDLFHGLAVFYFFLLGRSDAQRLH